MSVRSTVYCVDSHKSDKCDNGIKFVQEFHFQKVDVQIEIIQSARLEVGGRGKTPRVLGYRGIYFSWI